jgi:hypothetical protein
LGLKAEGYNMKSTNIKENKNFYWDEQGFLCHYSGENVGAPHYRFREHSEQERRKYICYEKSIKVTPHGVLVEYDSNRFDVENELDSYNNDDYSAKFHKRVFYGLHRRRSVPEKRRHYINKMFYNNNNELVFEQNDYMVLPTLIGQELARLCDSTVKLTDKGISVVRRNIAKEFKDMYNMIGDFEGSGEKIKIDNSKNEKEYDFFTYEELNENYKKKQAERKAYLKQQQEDDVWSERNRERLHKFGFNNITLKMPKGIAAHRAYKAWENFFDRMTITGTETKKACEEWEEAYKVWQETPQEKIN